MTETVKINVTFPSGIYIPDHRPTLDAHEQAFCDGYLARAMDLQLGANPYTPMTAESIVWAQGWIDADHDTEDQ